MDCHDRGCLIVGPHAHNERPRIEDTRSDLITLIVFLLVLIGLWLLYTSGTNPWGTYY